MAYNFDEYIEYRCSDPDMVAEPEDIAKFSKETFGIWYEYKYLVQYSFLI